MSSQSRQQTPNPLDPASAKPPFVFHLGPFRFESDLDIPELRGSTGPALRLVTIRAGSVPSAIDGATQVDPCCQLTATEYLLDIPGTARYFVRNGNEVRLETAPGAPIADVTTYLLGSVFGVLCHQNGLLPLHASAIEHHGGAIAFLGDSGAGKSTLAACLRRRGHTIVADDICLLDPAANSAAPHVVPVAGWLKLWNQSLAYLGETPEEHNRVFSTDDKFRVFLPGEAPSRLPLRRIVFLARHSDPQQPPSLAPVPSLEAITGLMDLTYAGYVPAQGGQKSRLFQQCARVARDAAAFRLTVPWDLARMDSVLELLHRELFPNALSSAGPTSSSAT